jgi:hypothetical protein
VYSTKLPSSIHKNTSRDNDTLQNGILLQSESKKVLNKLSKLGKQG